MVGQERRFRLIFFKFIHCFLFSIVFVGSLAEANSSSDTACPSDGSIVITHQDIKFTFFHNHTHDFVRYQVQTNISFYISPISPDESPGTFTFHLHGRCPKWVDHLQNESGLFTVPTQRPVPNLEFTCCSSERDTMSVKFVLDSETVSYRNFTLILSSIDEKTESDLVGVTRIPVSQSGFGQSANSTGSAMVVTNFHDIFARHSFPLVDSLTSLYTMTLTITVEETSRHYRHHTEELTVLANTPLSSINTRYIPNRKGGSGRARIQTWIFESTPAMPGSYLAFAIGRFQRNTAVTSGRKEINVWTPPGVSGSPTDSTRFALEMSSVLMDYFEEEFQFPYPLSKFDIVEVPLDYEAFVVWGLCFIRPGRLHVSKTNLGAHGANGLFGGAQALRETVPKKKELVETLAHEMSHQWFGSLVTPRTWNDVFLSESFATFYGVEAIRFARGVPQWMASEAMITALTHRKISLHTDHTIPISSPIMYKNWSRDMQFSTIVYHKGATLLRMLKWVIGDKTFRDGVRRYLRRFRYTNAGAQDFLDVFDQIAREYNISGWDGSSALNVTAFLRPYIYQPSYPVIHVKVNQSHATMTQEPYQYQPNAVQHQPDRVKNQWYVPITVHLQSKQMKTYWLKPNDTLQLPISHFGFMVRLFHLYAVRPTEEDDTEGDDIMD